MRLAHVILIIILLSIQCYPSTVRLDEFEVHGIDVSHHQSKILWDTVATQNIQFAFMKATEGGDWKDTLFCFNWEEANRVDILRGAYHFYRPNRSPYIQATNFIEQVNLEAGDLPPVLDIEVTDGIEKEELLASLRIWLEEVELHYNVKPVIYTNLKFYYQYLAGQFDRYPVWIARYREKEPRLVADKEWDFWQYGNRGMIPGIEGFVDFNVFHGSFEELEDLCLQSDIISVL